MENFDFRRITWDTKIHPGKIIELKNKTTHIGVYAGEEAQFQSDCPTDYEGTGKKKRKFFKRPLGATHYQFPNFKSTPSGYLYGRPVFFSASAQPTFCPSPFPAGTAPATV